VRAPETLLPELPITVSPEVQAEVRAVLEDARARGAGLSADLTAALDEALVRGGAAWDALRGERVGPPVARRRWPVALAAAAAGAAAGVGVAIALRRIRGGDAPDALEPEELVAVVDRG
jgi:hypothetical protein